MKFIMKFLLVIFWVADVANAQPESQQLHSHHHNSHHSEEVMQTNSEAQAQLSVDSIYHLDAVWTTQNNTPIRLAEFKDHIHVITMVYTSCDYVCPVIVNDIKKIEAGLSEESRNRVRFTLVSFDPERDTPAALKVYSDKRDLDTSRWTLISGDSDSILELAVVLGVKFKKDIRGGFSHSNIISVLDNEGIIRHQQVGLNNEPQPTLEVINRYISQAPRVNKHQ